MKISIVDLFMKGETEIMNRSKIIILISASLTLSIACQFISSSTPLNQTKSTPKPLYTLSGTLHPAREITIPRNIRVLVLWTILTEDPAYLYIFGEGKLDFQNYTFVINLNAPPPTEAMNRLDNFALGYGRVILTANQRWNGKIPVDSFSKDDIIGLAASHLVFYINGDVNSVSGTEWLNLFNQGYSVGKVVEMLSGPDVFEPVAPNTIQIIIDDLENIDIANLS